MSLLNELCFVMFYRKENDVYFYRAMHYVHCAVLRLHGVRLSVCLSVRLSVTFADCDCDGWPAGVPS